MKSFADIVAAMRDPTPLTDEQKQAFHAESAARSRALAAQVMQQSQVGCPASPSTAPAQPPTPADGRVWLVDTWPHRQAIKASGQAGYDSQARRWYLLDAARYDRIPPQCLPKGYKPPAQDHQDHPAPPPSQPTGLPPLAQALADAALASGHAVARFKCSDLGGKGWDVEDILAARDVLSGIPGLGVLVDLFGRTHRVHIRIKPITSRWPYDEGSAGDVPAPAKPQAQCQSLTGQAGAGGGSPQEPTADQAPAAVSPLDETPQAPVLQSPVPQPPQSATILALPWWPAGVRGVPNPVIRSALFGVVKRGRREHLERVRLPAIGGTEILYTGARLDQADLDAWMGILELFKGQDIAQRLGRVVVPAREFLRLIGREYSSGTRAWLYKSLARLQATAIEIKNGDQVYVGSLIVRAARDERTKQIMVEIDPKLAAMFHSWSGLDWQERQLLNTDLAKWLHGFYSSHADPYPIKVASLREWSGSIAKNLKHFRDELKQAMASIAAVTGWTWEIDKADCLHVHKPRQLPAG